MLGRFTDTIPRLFSELQDTDYPEAKRGNRLSYLRVSRLRSSLSINSKSISFLGSSAIGALALEKRRTLAARRAMVVKKTTAMVVS